MGGLIGRYFLESGLFKNRPGHTAVKRLVTLGTPHRGSPLALSAALGHEKRLFLSREQVLRLARDPRYPALYQLLPPRGEPFAWNQAATARLEAIDIYEATSIQRLGLVAANCQAAEAFHAGLDIANRPHDQGHPIRYFFFTGTRQVTASSSAILDLQTTPPTWRGRTVELPDAGDGTVPSWSGGLTGVQGQPVGGEHGTIYRNDDLRRTLAGLLGRAGVLAAAPELVEVALRERVVGPSDNVHVALTFGSGGDTIDGALVIQRAVLDAGGEVASFAHATSVHPIRYTGLNAEKLTVVTSAPGSPGVYRVAYFPAASDEPAGEDELFVQAPM
jgi:hypothetical protein